MKATKAQIDRLYRVIESSPSTHGGDVLDEVRDAVGRWDFRHYDELTSEEIERAISRMGGR